MCVYMRVDVVCVCACGCVCMWHVWVRGECKCAVAGCGVWMSACMCGWMCGRRGGDHMNVWVCMYIRRCVGGVK